MKRPAVLIVGAVAGALMVAGIGASAHTGLFVTKTAGLSGMTQDEASGARVEPSESPEPTETPEATPKAEPSETPEADDTDTDADETETDDNHQGAAPAGSGDHETDGAGHGD